MYHSSTQDMDQMSYHQTTTELSFHQKAFLHVGLALLLFVGLEYLLLQIPQVVNAALYLASGWMWLLVLGGFGLLTSMIHRWTLTSQDKTQQYLAFIGYIIVEALIFVPLLVVAISYSDSSLLLNAGILTAALSLGCITYGLNAKGEMKLLNKILTIGGFVALGIIVIAVLFEISLGMWFSIAMILFAGGSIIYEASKMEQRYNQNQYVGASLGLFASIMLMLWYVIRIFMARD